MKNKGKIIIALVAVLLCCFMAAFITACNNGDGTNNGGNKQGRVPVYQGMSISEATSTAATKSVMTMSAEIGSPDYSGDYSGRDEDIDKDNPFDNDDATPSESIEEVIESTLKVTGSVEPIYYATPNEDIFITIHINNPDSYEIMSFTLNGEKYSSYMFEYGSDMENLILKKNVGNVSGIVEYTIDEIKYIDGTEIKDVLIDGDQTVLAGVHTDNQVNAQVSESISFNDIELNITINDRDELLEYSSGKLFAILYDGESLLDQAELKVGSNTVTFDGLKTGGLYQYAVVGYYDSLIDGFKMNVLHKNAFFTENIVLFNNIEVTSDGISFGYAWHKNSTVNEISSLTLLKNSNETTLNANATSVSGLLSNNEYTLVARYLNNGKQEEIKLDFHTLTKVTPDITVTTDKVTQTGFDFAISATDTDNVGEITKIERIHNGQATTTDIATRHFDSLLSNNFYTVRVTYTYDLNDGTGAHTIVKEATATTLAKATPDIEVTTSNATQTGFDFDIAVTDTDSVGSITKIERVHGETATNADLATRHFDNLLSNSFYTVRVTYTYDLNDGAGEHELVKTATITTLAKATPEIEITDTDRTQYEISFDIAETDIDNVGEVVKIELLNGSETVYTTEDTTERTFYDLQPYVLYTIKITYKYNLNDGVGDIYTTADYSLYTLPVFETTDTECINSYPVSQGENIILQIKINNPSKATAYEIKVNGLWYAVDSTTTATNIRAQIESVGQFAGGETLLTVEAVRANIGDEYFTFELEENNSATCFVNGNIEVVEISVVDDNGNKKEYAYSTDSIYLQVTFVNPTGYKINSITINNSVYENEQLTVIDDNTVRVQPKSYTTSYTLNSYTYSNESIGTKTKDVENVFTLLATLSGTDEVIEIKTADDLKNMNGNKYYKLVNDIDLKDIPWDSPADFSGVFDGDGHTIKNMRVVGTTFENRDVYLGLFSHATGLIKNLNIEDTLIIVTVNNGSCYYGGLVAYVRYGDNLTIDNVKTSGEISLTYVNYASNPRAGGIVGYGYGMTIKSCSNTGTVSTTATSTYTTYTGGIIGACNNAIITNSYNTGDISGSHEVGGIVGQCSNATITNCNNTGNISGGARVGGIIGESGNSSINITNCYNTGNISGHQAGGIIGSCYSSANITNCHNTGIVNSVNNGGISYAGGIIGDSGNSSINITNCYNTGDIMGSICAGGIAGRCDNTTLINCYNTGNVTGIYTSYTLNIGRIIGYCSNTIITNCFYIAEGENLNYVGKTANDNAVILTDCYHFSEGTQGTKVSSIDELLSKMRELFDEDIWNFDTTTDYGFPTLR